MPALDERIDQYIAGKAPFAQPILAHLRAAVHRACPEVEEGLRWSMPSFSYRGKILCGMAAFKEHATFGFWQGRDIVGGAGQQTAMGQFGRLTSIADLPPDAELEALIRKAAAMIEAGQRAPRQMKSLKPESEVPADLSAALAANPAARLHFEAFAPSARRDYVDWLMEAKRPETRAKRLVEAIGWIAEGKKRHWKYEKC